MREEHALGDAGGAGRVLHVGRFVRVRAMDYAVGFAQERVPIGAAEVDDVFERGRGALERLFQDGLIIRAAVLAVEEQRADARLAHYKRHLVRAVSRVDIDQHHACQRATELEHGPLDAVGSPHSGAVAGSEAECAKPGRGAESFVGELLPGEAPRLVSRNNRGAGWKAADRFQEGFADRDSQNVGNRAARITQHPAMLHFGA